MSEVEPFAVSLSEQALGDLHERLRRTRWPEQPAGLGWELGVDIDYLRELCAYWLEGYDPVRLEDSLNAFPNWRWDGIHFLWERADGGGGLPVMLVHGWPGGPIEFRDVIPRLVDAGHDVIVPSLPGYAFSDAPEEPLNTAGVARRFAALMKALGYERYALQGGDWGAAITFQMAHLAPERVAALHLNAVSVLPAPADLSDPPLSEAEQDFIQRGVRWRNRSGHHLLLHSAAPDAVSVAFNDSPAGLAGWLLEKYRVWSDCEGEVERRFSKDDLCDFFTMYWATGTIAPSLRLYWAERRDRSRLPAGERVTVPAAVADFPIDIVPAPRDWAERLLADIRRWTEMPRGGHFAAFEEPELLSDDVIAFLGEVDSGTGQA
ncbi:MAG TPA: epoxide hydrolase [Solirubrobacterales bacterium]|nr:epoxide hydrolase [Solirubrobacterales bacterium]